MLLLVILTKVIIDVISIYLSNKGKKISVVLESLGIAFVAIALWLI